MVRDWRTVSLGQVVDILTGYPFKSAEYVTDLDGARLVRGDNIVQGTFRWDGVKRWRRERTSGLDSYWLQEGDVVVAMDRPWIEAGLKYASVRARDLPALLVQRVARLRGTNGLNSDFLRYVIGSRSFTEHVLAVQTGTAVPHISGEQIRGFEFCLPPVTEQRAIAHILGTLDDKIELNRRMSETLEQMAEAIFKTWFVDFEPVREKVGGKTPHLSSELNRLFPRVFQQTELGELPSDWQVRTIESVARRVGMGPFGASIKVETFVDEGVPVISGQHLHRFILEDGEFNYITTEHARRLASANVERGDVVFTHAGNIGQVAFIPDNARFSRYVISQRQFFMRCDPDSVTPLFIALYFSSELGRHQLLANTSSSGVPSIARPVTYLRSIKVPIPPRRILEAFDRLTNPIVIRLRAIDDESATLRRLRDSLVPKLISGELRVKEAERAVEAVL